ncbi:hypothetical protein BDQ17DRAFT_1355079 [Cyathus striatus]|nr:hypothetical protein BDQ17DRAFT_1355079 [Cyathus striatus]
MFPDANHFVIQGSTFHEHHVHYTSPPPAPASSGQLNIPPSLGELPIPTEVLPAGQYFFQNCEDPESYMCPALIRYLPDLPGVAEVLSVGFKGKTWVTAGNLCVLGEKPSRWFFEQVGESSEWFYIRPYDKPSKTLSGRAVHGSKYGDMFLEDLEHRGAPIHLFKAILIDVPQNSGIVPPGYYYFQNIQTGTKSSLSYVRYKKDELAVAVILGVEVPGLYWTLVGDACQVTRKQTEWCFEIAQSELRGSGIFFIYPRDNPKRVLSGEEIEGSPLGDLRVQYREPETSLLQLWKAIPVNLPENSGVLPAGIYKFTNVGNKFETNETLVQYSIAPGRIGVANLSVVSHPGTFWTYTEVTCTGGFEPGEWFFQHVVDNVYYICPLEQPYPKMRVVSGETIDGEPSGDYLIQDKIVTANNDPSDVLMQLWLAVKV